MLMQLKPPLPPSTVLPLLRSEARAPPLPAPPFVTHLRTLHHDVPPVAPLGVLHVHLSSNYSSASPRPRRVPVSRFALDARAVHRHCLSSLRFCKAVRPRLLKVPSVHTSSPTPGSSVFAERAPVPSLPCTHLLLDHGNRNRKHCCCFTGTVLWCGCCVG